MIIGFMRNQIVPPYMAKLTALLSKGQGIDIIYLNPKDVDMENKTVKGKMFLNNQWVTVETDLPKIIDISQYCYNIKNREVMAFLRSQTFLTDNGLNRLSKDKLQEKLREDGEFTEILIPTKKVTSFNSIIEFLEEYGQVVLKPVHGERGKGIYILSRNKEKYVLGHLTREQSITEKQLISFFDQVIKDKKYILQKYIASRTKNGDPFDCRVHVEKNGNGKWVSAKNFIRIGIGQKVISNVNQGGGISNLQPFLKANFGEEKWKKISGKIDRLARTLPYKIEELRGTHVMSIGLDIGIDSDGSLYLFEANGAPTTAPLRAEAAMLRVEYYKYIIDKKIYLNKDK